MTLDPDPLTLPESGGEPTVAELAWRGATGRRPSRLRRRPLVVVNFDSWFLLGLVLGLAIGYGVSR